MSMLTPQQAQCPVCRHSSYLLEKIPNHQRYEETSTLSKKPTTTAPRRRQAPNPGLRWAHGCPYAPRGEYVRHETGELIAWQGPRCGLIRCSDCLAWKARRVELALHLVEPQAFVTLGQAGATPEEVAINMTALRRRLRAVVSDWQDAYFVEPHRYRPGFHVHLFAHRPVSHEVLTDLATRSGFHEARNIMCKPVSTHAVYGYPLKTARKNGDQTAFREGNRGRVVHATRDFWTGPDGVPVDGGYVGLVQGYRL